jgi:hypothetical protein
MQVERGSTESRSNFSLCQAIAVRGARGESGYNQIRFHALEPAAYNGDAPLRFH